MTGSTHTSPHGNPSLIDLAFTSSPCQLLDCCVIPPIANSDHNGLKITVNWKPSAQSPRPGQNTRTIWHYAHADFDKARDLIHSTEWDTICTSDDVDSCWAKWQSKFLLIMEESIPKRVLPPRRRNLPWINKKILLSQCGNEIHYTKGLRDLVIHFILQSSSMQEIKWCLICAVLRLTTSED